MPRTLMLSQPAQAMPVFNRQKLKTVSCFLLVGGGSFLVDLMLFLILLHLAKWPVLLARFAGFSIGLGLTWWGHRCVTFSHRKQLQTRAQMKWVVAVAIVAGMANLLSFSLIRTWLPTSISFEVFSVAFGVLIGLIVNGLGANYLTYRSQPDGD